VTILVTVVVVSKNVLICKGDTLTQSDWVTAIEESN